MFHVLEHIPDPIPFLRAMRTRLRPGGIAVIEVPHARDALLSIYESEAFRDFTLWSQHLVLHTRASLSAFVTDAGFGTVRIEGVQRYPLANHLFWLAKGRPGGQAQWPELADVTLDAAYLATLDRLDATDTLLAVVS
jgi:SAM-dependent methyltransferase